MGTEDDTAEAGDGGFADVESFFHEEGAQHEQACEAAEDEVGEMGLVDGELLPSHGGWKVGRRREFEEKRPW